jgi:hypothetical protein
MAVVRIVEQLGRQRRQLDALLDRRHPLGVIELKHLVLTAHPVIHREHPAGERADDGDDGDQHGQRSLADVTKTWNRHGRTLQ